MSRDNNSQEVMIDMVSVDDLPSKQMNQNQTKTTQTRKAAFKSGATRIRSKNGVVEHIFKDFQNASVECNALKGAHYDPMAFWSDKEDFEQNKLAVKDDAKQITKKASENNLN